MLLPKRQRWRMSPRTSSVRLLTRSRPHVLLHRKERARAPAGSSAVGSAGSSRLRSANLSWRISGCETRSAGRCSTADGRDGPSAPPNERFEPTPQARYAYAGRNWAYNPWLKTDPGARTVLAPCYAGREGIDTGGTSRRAHPSSASTSRTNRSVCGGTSTISTSMPPARASRTKP